MHEWTVTLTQNAPRPVGLSGAAYVDGRWTAARVSALDERDAARRAQRVYPGWTAVLVERVS